MSEHPFKLLHANRFRVTLNTDDRLMSGITLTDEFLVAHREFQLTLPQLFKLTINAMKSAFICFKDRTTLMDEVLQPAYEILLEKYKLKTMLED
jgi:adenosine deaminase